MGKRLYVGSLPFEMTEDQIHELFGQQGKVVNTKLIRDKYTGQSRGFAFVEMESDEEAKNAIEKLNGHMIGTRKLTVNEARPQEDRGPGGFGGGPRGGGRRPNFRGRRGLGDGGGGYNKR